MFFCASRNVFISVSKFGLFSCFCAFLLRPLSAVAVSTYFFVLFLWEHLIAFRYLFTRFSRLLSTLSRQQLLFFRQPMWGCCGTAISLLPLLLGVKLQGWRAPCGLESSRISPLCFDHFLVSTCPSVSGYYLTSSRQDRATAARVKRNGVRLPNEMCDSGRHPDSVARR